MRRQSPAIIDRVTEDFDDIRDQIEEWEWQLDGEDFEATLVDKFDSLAPGDPGRAELLYSVGERWEGDDPQRALPWFERAVAEPGQVTLDPRGGVLNCLLALGRDTDADELERQLRRASAAGEWRGAFHDHVGEVLELAGRTRQALRWFNMGLRDFDLDDPDVDDLGCLNGRYRVRRGLDLPYDLLDVYLDEYREYRRVDPA